MDYHLSITKLVLATFPLLGPSMGATLPAASVESTSEGCVSGKNCEQFAFPVNCHANVNFPNASYYYDCFDTMCDAAAAGAYECRKKFKGTCEPTLAVPSGSIEVGPR
jgi:hypothetical protein